MRHLALLLVLLAGTAFATQDSVAFGQRLVSTGDSVGKVIEVAGQPDRTVRLENSQGGAAGERFEYYLRGKTVTLWIHGGRVVAIEEVLD